MSATEAVTNVISPQGPVRESTPDGKLFFSRLQGMKVIDLNGKTIGKLKDFGIRPGEVRLEVSSIVYSPGVMGQSVTVQMSRVESIYGVIKLKVAQEDIPPGKLGGQEMLVTETILDKQIVDIDGLKVVRVNDVLLARVKGSLCLMGVDVGFKGILRRLGFTRISEEVLRTVPDHIIPWSYIDPLDPDLRRIHLKIPRKNIQDLHPADIADILEELDNKDRLLILKSLDEETAAEAMEEMEPEVQATTIRHMDSDDVADILENMNPDDAADLLNMMPEDKASEVLGLMEPEEAKDVRELLEYDEGSTGSIMTTEFVHVTAGSTASDVFKKLRDSSHDIDMIYYVYVLNEAGQLIGVMSLRDLLMADPDGRVTEFMERELLTITPDSTVEECASLLSKYDLLAVPVLAEDGEMLGIVAVDDALDYIIPEDLRKQLPENYRKKPKSL